MTIVSNSSRVLVFSSNLTWNFPRYSFSERVCVFQTFYLSSTLLLHCSFVNVAVRGGEGRIIFQLNLSRLVDLHLRTMTFTSFSPIPTLFLGFSVQCTFLQSSKPCYQFLFPLVEGLGLEGTGVWVTGRALIFGVYCFFKDLGLCQNNYSFLLFAIALDFSQMFMGRIL